MLQSHSLGIESDPKLITNPEIVELHSFDTKIHKVNTLVSYKYDEWDEQQWRSQELTGGGAKLKRLQGSKK